MGAADPELRRWGGPASPLSLLSSLQALLVPELPVLGHSDAVVGWMQAVATGAALTSFSGGTFQIKMLFCLLPSLVPVDYLTA